MVLLFFSTCKKKTTSPDNPPEFKSYTPTEQTTTTKIGNTHTVTAEAEDSDGDSFQYKTFKDGSQVNDSNEYTFTIHKKGMTKIQVVVYNALSDTLTRYFSAENQVPVAIDTSITMDEESTKNIGVDVLGTDTDGDALTYSITSKNNVDANIENGNLTITGLYNYFGPANITYTVTDGDLTATGTINIEFTNTTDDPIADAGTDKTGTIDEDIQLDGGASSHPDDPISSITNFTWKALNGDPTIDDSDNTIATFRATTSGTYDIELTITDDKGVTAKDTVSINIDSYKLTVNTTNVLTDAPLAGLEVMLAGKTAFTNSEGTATLEYPTNATISGNLKIQDENIEGDIGDLFNYSDTESTSINSDKTFNIEMVPNVEFDSQFYTDIFDFITQMRNRSTVLTPGEYPEDYPIQIDVKENDMPAEHYKQATNEAIEHINNTLGWEVYKTTTGDDARYIFDYTHDNSKFEPSLTQINDVWYIDTATVYITNAAPNNENDFEILKGEITHELFTHGLGWPYHSLDGQDISNTPVWDSDISTNEKNAMEIFLKFQGGTNMDNYQLE